MKTIRNQLNIKPYQEDVENLLKLIGLLTFFEIGSASSIANQNENLKTTNELLNKINGMTFIPGVFFLIGIESVSNGEIIGSKKNWEVLEKRFKDYTAPNAALKNLHQWVLNRIRNS